MRDGGCTYLHACLLLLLAERPDHGYDLVPRLAPLGLSGVDGATTYRALRALEREGHVGSQWTPSPGGPARRVYHLTREGQATLAAVGGQLRRDQAQVMRFLGRLDALLDHADSRAAVRGAR
jgi:DNA-binding PadR family transcriptional regulator